MALLKLAKMDTTATLTEVLEKLSDLSGKSSGTSAQSGNLFGNGNSASSKSAEKKSPETKTAKTSMSPSADVSSGKMTRGQWLGFLGEFTQINGMLSTMLKRGQPTLVKENIVELAFPSDAGMNALMTSDKVKLLETSMEKHFGRHLRIKLTTDSNMTTNEPATTLDPRFDIAPDDFLERNPEVKRVVEKYDGRITSIKKIDSKE
jgi:hypothetical protein